MCQQIDCSAILTAPEVAFCLKCVYMISLKSCLIKTTFSEIYLYKNGQKVLAIRAIELNLM